MNSSSALKTKSALINAAAPQHISKYLAPGDRLAVMGRFSSAVYMRTPRNRLVMLHDREHGLVPFGLAVENARELIPRLGLDMGTCGVYEDGGLYIGENFISVGIYACDSSPCPAPSLAELNLAMGRASAALNGWAGGMVKDLLLDTGSGNPFARAAAGPAASLRTAMSEGDGELVDEALKKLLGLGPGLTPSMDDFLSALCATLLWARDRWRITLPGTQLLADGIARLAREHTGEISAAYLQSSADGEEIEQLVRPLCRLPELMSRDSLHSLLTVGANSGADMLTGMIFALRVITENI